MTAPSRSELIAAAVRALSAVPDYVWDGRSLPVPIDSIAEDHYGLLIREVDDIGAEVPALDAEAGQQISGALVPSRAEILVDAREVSRWPRRRRFTIAHELGHWVLHRNSPLPLCREAAIKPVEALNPGGEEPSPVNGMFDPESRREWEANVFGGACLLPPRLVREFWDRQPSVEAMADAFDCSLSAVGPRWAHHYAAAAVGNSW